MKVNDRTHMHTTEHRKLTTFTNACIGLWGGQYYTAAAEDQQCQGLWGWTVGQRKRLKI